MKSRPNQKHRKRKPRPQQRPPQQQQQQQQQQLRQHFVRRACQTSMLQTRKRLHRTFRAKLVLRFLSSAALPSSNFAGLRRRACQTSMLQTPKRLSRAFHAKLAQRFLRNAALRFDTFEGFSTLKPYFARSACQTSLLQIPNGLRRTFHISYQVGAKTWEWRCTSISCQVGPKIFEQSCTSLRWFWRVELYFECCACQTSMFQIPKGLRRAFHAKLAQKFVSKAALLFGDFEGFWTLARYFSRCACQTSMLQISKVLRIVFPAKFTRRVLSKAALLFGDFQCNAISFTLCVSNFQASNPRVFHATLAQRFLSKDALLFGDLEGFWISKRYFAGCACQISPNPEKITENILVWEWCCTSLWWFCRASKTMFCTLCLWNFHSSNPKKIAKNHSYQVGAKIFE